MRRFIFGLIILLLAGCSAFPIHPATPAATGTPPLASQEPLATPSLKVKLTSPVTATEGATPSLGFLKTLETPTVLTLWVPPMFNPYAENRAAVLLRERLAEFEKENKVSVQVRVKDERGPGSLLEALTASSAAAPLTLPSVIALPRTDLEVAAAKGLIQPLDGLSTTIDEPDWYSYARDLAMVQGAAYGLPFAGDALLLAYHQTKVTTPPTDWEGIFRMGQPLAFPAADEQALFTLALYTSLGGQVEDAQRRPTLDADVLSRVLGIYSDGESRGIFPYWLSQYETFPQTWQAYSDRSVNAVVAWTSQVLSAPASDSALQPLASLGAGSSTLANGWDWAVADPIPERRSLATHLAEYLSAGDFLAAWTEAAGYLPTRPSSLAAWTNSSYKVLLSPIAASARARPTADLVNILGPILKDATLKVLKKDSDAAKAAQAAVDRVMKPQN